MNKQTLAIEGGAPVRSLPWPKRRLFGIEEKNAACRLFDQAIESGEAFGYNGAEEQAYCAEFSAFLGGGFADAVNSGTTAVYVALRALELEPFSEVIVPPVTDPGGVMPVPLTACIPVPADTAPDSYNTDAERIRQRITPRTGAIIVAHIAGHPCDMDPIMELANSRGIPVIEDCAQAHGAKYKDRYVGTIGAVGAFSTMFGKHHASGGQGGIVFTRNESLYQKIRWMSDRGKPFGLPPESGNIVASLNLNTDELACAIGREQLRKLPAILEKRRRFAALLTRECAKVSRSVSVLSPPPRCESSFWFIFLKLRTELLKVSRNAFVEALKAEGLPLSPSYPHRPATADWCINHKAFGATGFPWTAPQYEGDPDSPYPLPNAEATDERHFMLYFNENFAEREAEDIVSAIKKAENAYLS